MRNIRLAFRTLLRTPFVTTVAVLSLALGIGANAAIFSMFDEILLRPVQATNPGELVNLGAPGPKPGSQSCGQAGSCELVFSYPMFRDLQQASTGVLSGLAAHVAFGSNIAFRKQTRSGGGTLVSGSYFPLLGLQPALGRLIGPADDETIGAHAVAVLSYRYWDSVLGSDPSVLNELITINGKLFTIIGVAPRDFNGTTLGELPDVFVPITMHTQVKSWFKDFESRQCYWAYLFGRLKPGVSIEQANAELDVIYSQMLRETEAPLQKGMSPETLERFKAKTLTVTDGRAASRRCIARPRRRSRCSSPSPGSSSSSPAPTSPTCSSRAGRGGPPRWRCACR